MRRLLAAVIATIGFILAPTSHGDAATGCRTWITEASGIYPDGTPYWLKYLKGSCDHLDGCEVLRVKGRFRRFSDGATVIATGDPAYQSNEVSTIVWRPTRYRLLERWVVHPCVT